MSAMYFVCLAMIVVTIVAFLVKERFNTSQSKTLKRDLKALFLLMVGATSGMVLLVILFEFM